MDIDQWGELKDRLRAKFPIEDEGTEDLIMGTGEGPVKHGTAEFLVFTTPIGKVKLACEKKPVVLEKREVKSHRAGQSTHNEYTFSQTEFFLKLKAYKWNDRDEDWDEIDAANFS